MAWTEDLTRVDCDLVGVAEDEFEEWWCLLEELLLSRDTGAADECVVAMLLPFLCVGR